MGKVALITGGRSGIGLACAQKLSETGYDVVTAQRSPAANFYSIEADLSDPETPQKVIQQVIDRHGRLDALINNAGIMLKYVGGIDGNQMDGMAFVDFRGQKFKSEFSATREVKVSSLAGTWNTEMKRDGNTTTNTFKLSVGEDGEISGTFGKDATKEIEAVKLEDGVLTFSIKRQYSGNDFVMNYRGQIEGDEIRGEVIIKAGGVERRKYPWKAKKVN